MSVTHPTAVRDTVCDSIVDSLDPGGPGKLVFRLSGTAAAPGTAVATLTFSATAFGASSSGTATAAAITSDTNATGNASPVATATMQTAAGTVKVHCAVAASGSDINMTGGLTVGAGDTVACSALTYTAMP
jgi:hypothetical protein